MTVKEINEQFELAKLRCSEVVDLDSTPPIHYTAIKASTALAELDRLQSLVHQIYSQAKAEQREETARIVANKIISEARKCRFEEEGQSFVTIGDLITVANEAVDSIASEIRGQK